MKDYFNKLSAQAKEYWVNLNKSQKIRIIVIFVVTIAAMSVLMVIVTRPHYVTLYSNLSDKDAGAIATKLKSDMKIPYKLADGGSTILVPQQYRDEARMQLATQGLPQSGFTIDDAFKNSSLGTTDMERQKRYLYFLQNEIADAIKTINGVHDAQVLIVVPDNSTFVLSNNQQDATAAIKLDLDPGVTLNKNQINGIVQFVSKSIQQLKPQNITIIDQNGTILDTSGDSSDTGIDSVNTQYQLQNEIETNIKKNVQSLLEQVFGPGNVGVRVNAKLNFDTQKESSVQYSPVIDTNGIIRSIQTIQETQLNGSNNGQQPGTSTNGGTNTYTQGGQQNNNYSKTNKTINYEINEIRKEIQKAKGGIDNLTVAVVINKNNLSPTVKNNVIQIVSNTTGTNAANVTVNAMPFNTSLASQMSNLAKQQAAARTQSLILWGLLIAALAGGGIASYTIYRRKNQPSIATPVPQQTLEMQAPETELLDRINNKSNNRRELEKLIKEKPEIVAQVIRSLLQRD